MPFTSLKKKKPLGFEHTHIPHPSPSAARFRHPPRLILKLLHGKNNAWSIKCSALSSVAFQWWHHRPFNYHKDLIFSTNFTEVFDFHSQSRNAKLRKNLTPQFCRNAYCTSCYVSKTTHACFALSTLNIKISLQCSLSITIY